jgi:Zn-dependent protease with chaperone function
VPSPAEHPRHDAAFSGIPVRAELERTARSARNRGRATIALLLLVDVWLAWAFVTRATAATLVTAGILLALSLVAHVAWLVPFLGAPRTRLDRLGPSERVGRWSAGEVLRMMVELLQPHRDREQPNVYLTEGRYDGAYVVNSLFFDFIRPLNAVFVSRHLFRILRPIEIKAVLAHELAHFHRHIPLVSRTQMPVVLLHTLAPVVLLDVARPGGLHGALLLWFGMLYVANRLRAAHVRRHSRTLEYLCDLQAAQRFGVLAVINGLLGIAKTAEVALVVHYRLVEEIRRDDTLGLHHLPQLLRRIEDLLPDRPTTREQLETAIRTVLDSPETRTLRARQSDRSRRDEARAVERLTETLLANKKWDLVDWAGFDNVEPDGRVDAAEYPLLIDALKTHAGRQLFALPTDDAAAMATGTHPTMRERILFLETCRLEAARDPKLPALRL